MILIIYSPTTTDARERYLIAMQQSEHERHRFNEVREESSEVTRPLKEEAFPPILLIGHQSNSLKYNCNHDKGSEETFGFTSEYPDVQSVEFCNNTSDACLFHGSIPSEWSDDFEFRYPDGHADISAFKEMHDWVVSTYQIDATGEALAETYIDVDGNQHTHDTAAYRLAKFKTEFEDHFDMEYALVYYVYTFFALMVDQRAKNLFLTSWDKKHWLCYFYDNDFEILSL